MSPGVIIFWSAQTPPAGFVRREVLTPKVRAGDHFKLRIVRDVPTYCTAQVKRQIIDGAGYVWEQGISPRPQVSEYIVDLPVPRGAREGTGRYHAEIHWSCNPWQRWYPKVTIQQETYFEILPSEEREKLQQLPEPSELKEELKQELQKELFNVNPSPNQDPSNHEGGFSWRPRQGTTEGITEDRR